MMTFSDHCNDLFDLVVALYHQTDSVDTTFVNPCVGEPLFERLALKCWIDSVQWHLEDLIRDPNIDPVEALALKRRIDRSNQERTDCVEEIDTYFNHHFSCVVLQPDATLNSETPAWALDRLSILALKIYHMREQTTRPDASAEHRAKCQARLNVLLEQRVDLSLAIDQLLSDYAVGRKKMKVYRQMKMYNDPATNPILYGKK